MSNAAKQTNDGSQTRKWQQDDNRKRHVIL